MEDAACLSMRAMGEQSQGFEACLRQKTMGEQNRVVEDFRGEMGEKRHYASVLSNRLRQPTHQKNSSMYEEAEKGKVMIETHALDKYNSADVVQKGVKDGYEEEVKKEMILQMVHATHLSAPLPRVYWITQCCTVFYQGDKFRILKKCFLFFNEVI